MKLHIVLVGLIISGCLCPGPVPQPPAPVPAPGSGEQSISVQVWNHFDREARFKIVATSEDGVRTVTIDEGLRVSKNRQPVRPDLGGDPNAIGVAHATVPAGRWTVSVLEVESGSQLRADVVPGGPHWVIAFASAQGGQILLDSAPRALE